jgi:hypothetical protein
LVKGPLLPHRPQTAGSNRWGDYSSLTITRRMISLLARQRMGSDDERRGMAIRIGSFVSAIPTNVPAMAVELLSGRTY